MRSVGCLLAAACAAELFCNLVSPVQAAPIDIVVGAVAPGGGAQLLKRFRLPPGSNVVGVELVSNDVQTVFPRVALLEGPVDNATEVVLLREARDVRSSFDKHRIRIAVPPLVVPRSGEIYVAVTLPASNGVQGPGVGAALGATQLSAPPGSFIASSDGTLQPASVDLSIDLTVQPAGKAQAGEDRATVPTTSLHIGSANPNSQVTRITLGLERAGIAMLTIYDVAGRQVRTLVRETLNAGTHAREWDGRDDDGHTVAGGIYLVRLAAADKVLTQKLARTR